MFCTNCGKKIDNDSNFCIYCGTPMKSIQIEEKAEMDLETRIPQSTEVFIEPNLSQSKPTKPPKIVLYDETYKIDTTPSLVGFLMIVMMIIFYLNGQRYTSDFSQYEDYLQAKKMQDYFSGFLFLSRIPIVFWVVRIAERRNRSSATWGILSFFFPAIVLIILGQKRKLKYKM